MPHHNGSSHADQIVFLEERHRKIVSRIDELRRVASFYELALSSPDAKETGAQRDALEWLIEQALAIAKDPLMAS